MNNIVILGGGFGGVQTAIKLNKKIKNKEGFKKYKIILVDKNDYHTFTPLLYEIATTSPDTSEYKELKSLVTFNLKELFKNTDVEIIKSKVQHINVEKRLVSLENKEMKFDYLVLALGSRVDYFQTPGVKENAFKLKTFEDAISIRDEIMSKIKEDRKVEVVIGGGGSTGVELAGEIREWTCKFEEEKNCKVNITLVEGSSKILSGFEDKIIKKAENRLKKLGVNIITGNYIEKVTNQKEILLSGGERISYDTLIWSAGIKAASITKDLPTQKTRSGRVEVIGDLECIPNNDQLKVYENIYAIGDISCTYDPKTGNPTPAVARSAIEQGRVVAYNIFNKKDNPKEYKYKKYPYIIPIGGKYAVAKVGPLVVSGFIAWVFKGIVELNYLISILPFFKALKVWFKGLKIFIKNDRLG